MPTKVHENLHRFLAGVSTVSADDPLGALPYPDPTKWCILWEDFGQYDAAQATSYYTFTQTNFTDAVVGPSGVLTLTSAGGDNDLGQLYLTQAPFQLTAAKKAIFECKCYVDAGAAGTIGQQELFIGLSSIQTGNDFMAADGLSRTMDDAIGFISYDGDANIDYIQGENDVFSEGPDATTYADETWMTLSWYWNGYKTDFFKDDIKLGELTTNPPTSVLTPMLYLKGGEAKACVLAVDYYLVAVER
jgi:hypothetical protein